MTLQVRNLRERLEEEHTALLAREADKVALEQRLARLTRLVLSSARLLSHEARSRGRPKHKRTVSDLVSAVHMQRQQLVALQVPCYRHQSICLHLFIAYRCIEFATQNWAVCMGLLWHGH